MKQENAADTNHLPDTFHCWQPAGRVKFEKSPPEVIAMALFNYLFFNNLSCAFIDNRVLSDSEEIFDEFVDVLTRGILSG